MSSEQGWDQYSKLVLKQLETLAHSVEGLRVELQALQEQLTELRAKEERIEDLRTWKTRVDDVVSPTQLRASLDDLEELKMFRTKAVTIFTGVQFLMGIALTIIALL
jgi:Tfp pilus assembly protein PilO